MEEARQISTQELGEIVRRLPVSLGEERESEARWGKRLVHIRGIEEWGGSTRREEDRLLWGKPPPHRRSLHHTARASPGISREAGGQRPCVEYVSRDVSRLAAMVHAHPGRLGLQQPCRPRRNQQGATPLEVCQTRGLRRCVCRPKTALKKGQPARPKRLPLEQTGEAGEREGQGKEEGRPWIDA